MKKSTNVVALLCMLAITSPLAGCGLAQQLQQTEAALKNPSALVGKFYEVAAKESFCAWTSPEVCLQALDVAEASHNDNAKVRSEFLDKGLAAELNEGTNEENAKANLIIEVESYRMVNKGNDQKLFLKIKAWNKKHADTSWWILGPMVFVQASPCDAPIAQTSAPKPKTSNHSDSIHTKVRR